MPSQRIKRRQRFLEKREREIGAAYFGKKIKKGSDDKGRSEDRGDGHR